MRDLTIKSNSSFIIALTGPSQSGKSLVLSKIKSLAPILQKEGYIFQPQLVVKKTTRDYRIEELQALENGKSIDVEHVDKIPTDCDLVYQTYGMRYALSTKELTKLLNENKSPYVVINDIRAVEELKEAFPERVLSIFLFRKIPDLADFKKEASVRGNVSEAEVYARYEKAVAIYRMYIENIALFDKVILNAIEYNEEKLNDPNQNIIDQQLINVIRGVLDNQIKLRKNTSALHSSIPKTFILAGNAASGKDELIRAVKDLGKLQAEIIPKYTVRRQEEDDEDEMICRFRPKCDYVEKLKKEFDSEIEYTKTELEKVSENIRGQRFLTEWEEMKKKIFSKIPDWRKRFWGNVEKTEENQVEKYFELNPMYKDLVLIKEKGNEIYRENDDTILVEYQNEKYMIYHAKGKVNKLYGCKVEEPSDKYRVLVASQYGAFNIFKRELGADNVAIIYSHSQISENEFVSNTKNMAAREKREKFNEYLQDYVKNIVYYDHVVIYAKAHLTNEQSIKEEELIDQMFRLFRVY